MSTPQYRAMYGDKCPPRAGDKWTWEEDKRLVKGVQNMYIAAYSDDMMIKAIAVLHGRRYNAISSRLTLLLRRHHKMPSSMIARIGLVKAVAQSDWNRLFHHFDLQMLLDYELDKHMPDTDKNDDQWPKRFWMVKGNNATHVHHLSEQAAVTEAVRLAQKNPGQDFYVLQTTKVVHVEATPPPVVMRDL